MSKEAEEGEKSKIKDEPKVQEKVQELKIQEPKEELRLQETGAGGSLGYRGGLKVIERQLGLARSTELQGLCGADAGRLWNRWRHRRDEEARETLLAYNEADWLSADKRHVAPGGAGPGATFQPDHAGFARLRLVRPRPHPTRRMRPTPSAPWRTR